MSRVVGDLDAETLRTRSFRTTVVRYRKHSRCHGIDRQGRGFDDCTGQQIVDRCQQAVTANGIRGPCWPPRDREVQHRGISQARAALGDRVRIHSRFDQILEVYCGNLVVTRPHKALRRQQQEVVAAGGDATQDWSSSGLSRNRRATACWSGGPRSSNSRRCRPFEPRRMNIPPYSFFKRSGLTWRSSMSVPVGPQSFHGWVGSGLILHPRQVWARPQLGSSSGPCWRRTLSRAP